MGEIVSEMDYLRHREQKLRDTNESTNNRVKWFGFLTTFLLVGLWAWQIMYLRAYFRYVSPEFCLIWKQSLTLWCAGRSILFNELPGIGAGLLDSLAFNMEKLRSLNYYYLLLNKAARASTEL